MYVSVYVCLYICRTWFNNEQLYCCRLDQFKIIKFPLTTESAMKKIEDNNTLVFIVDKRSTKVTIQKAVKKLYDIQVAKVNTLIRYEERVSLPFHLTIVLYKMLQTDVLEISPHDIKL